MKRPKGFVQKADIHEPLIIEEGSLPPPPPEVPDIGDEAQELPELDVSLSPPPPSSTPPLPAASPLPASPPTSSKIPIEAPRLGRSISVFCAELVNGLEKCFTNWSRVAIRFHDTKTFTGGNATSEKTNDPISCRWCFKNGLVGRIVPLNSTNGLERVMFKPFTAEEFVTAIEEHFDVFRMVGGVAPASSSLSAGHAKVILVSDILRNALPKVDRLFIYAIPIGLGIYGTNKAGVRLYKPLMCPPGFGSYVDPSGEVVNFYCHKTWKGSMSLPEAKALFDKLYYEFKFRDSHSKTHAIAHLLTPFCQSLMGWRKKAPLWIFTADKSRSGKDYLAMISLIINEGVAVQDPPLEDESELKRRITSAIVAGRRFQHLANCRGDPDKPARPFDLDSPALEAAITSEFWSDRLIGTSESPVMTNEIIFSLSYNGDQSMTPDLAFRSRRVHLQKPSFATNKHAFKTPNLHSLLYSWGTHTYTPPTGEPAAFEPSTVAIVLQANSSSTGNRGSITAAFENPNPFAVPYKVVVTSTDASMLNGKRALDFSGIALPIETVDLSAFLSFKYQETEPTFTVKIFRVGEANPDVEYKKLPLSDSFANIHAGGGAGRFGKGVCSIFSQGPINKAGVIGTLVATFENPNLFAVPYEVEVAPTNATMSNGVKFSGIAFPESINDISALLPFVSTSASPSFEIKIFRTGESSPDVTYKDVVCPPAINRQNVLSALLALIENWASGKKSKPIFTSFPEWAATVGGIMIDAGLGDPTTVSARDLFGNDAGEAEEWLRLGAWLAIHNVCGESSGAIFSAMKEYSLLFPLILLREDVSFGSSLSKWASKSPHFPTQIKVEFVKSTKTRKKYKFSFRDDDFLKTYVDFAEVAGIPQHPPEFSKEIEEDKPPQTPQEPTSTNPNPTSEGSGTEDFLDEDEDATGVPDEEHPMNPELPPHLKYGRL